MNDLKRGQAHVWTLPVGPENDAGIERLGSVLSARENARAGRIGPERNRREYLAAQILGRRMLSHFSDVAPADWRFEAGPRGRPEPAPEVNAGKLRFNLSHANGMIACAVTKEDDIGVDIEWLERKNQIEKIAEKKFAAPEAAYLRTVPEEDRRNAFFSFWTLKESYIKAIGMGLAEPLDGFAFDLDSLSIRFLNDNGDSACWSFEQHRPSPVHLSALAIAHPPGGKSTVIWRALGWRELLGSGPINVIPSASAVFDVE